ncbi:MAG TPA: hypothetical protein VF488_06555, partial [Gemmatimonadaceae bacterium]
DRTADGGTTLTSSTAAKRAIDSPTSLLSLVTPGDYVGILAYLAPSEELAKVFGRFRADVRLQTHAATMFGYGPRYLHSTGQLHKGGANSGVFVLISHTPSADLDIPGQPFTFGTLELAQALGDFNSLDATGRRAVHIHLPAPDPKLVSAALDSLLVQTSRS